MVALKNGIWDTLSVSLKLQIAIYWGHLAGYKTKFSLLLSADSDTATASPDLVSFFGFYQKFNNQQIISPLLLLIICILGI